MELTVTFSISALEVFENWDLEYEICYALYCMADDNNFGDSVSEAILDICGNDYDRCTKLYNHISYNPQDLKAVNVHRYNDRDLVINYSIPVTFNI